MKSLDEGAAQRSTALPIAVVVALAILAFSHPGLAQHMNRVAVGVAFSSPRGELDRDIDDYYGPALAYLRTVGSSRRIAVGAMGVGGEYGSVDRPLSIPGFRARTGSSIAFLLMLVQLERSTGAVQPYLQAAGGYGWFITTTTVTCDDCTPGALMLNDFDEGALAGGGGGGVRLRLYQRTPKSAEDRDPLRVELDLVARYLRSREARYVPGDPVVTPEGNLVLEDLPRAAIQVIQYQIGVAFAF